MATELTVQSERAFQKQPHIFQNPKVQAKSKKVGKGRRWYKDVGLGFRTPKTAIEGTYIGMHDLFYGWRKFEGANVSDMGGDGNGFTFRGTWRITGFLFENERFKLISTVTVICDKG